MKTPKVILAILSALAMVGFGGCAGKTRYPNYYVLNPPPPVAPQPKPPGSLGTLAVRAFKAPAYLTSGPIVYRPSHEEVGFYNYHHWAEDPRAVVTLATRRELEARGIFQSVSTFDGHGSPSWLLTGTLDHLEEVDEGTSVSAEVELSASLTNMSTGDVVWRGSASQRGTVDQHSISGIVAEMSRDVSVAVGQLASSMQNRLSTVSLTSEQ